jgi:putative SOS response-associated peptidase YedK
MCGRFTRYYTWEQIYGLYRLTSQPANLQPRYNICPTDTIDVVVRGDDQRSLVPMRWGLIPAWWQKSLKEMRLATFNARAETIADKPMFRDSFKRRRCLIPASGYYEWNATPEGKQPYYFTLRDGRVVTIGGIQDAWNDPQSGERMRSCAMVITEPNKYVAEVHDRMPVILEEKDFEQWERGDVKDAAALIKPAPEELLQKWPVPKRVNSSKAPDDDPTLIERSDGIVDQAALAETMQAVARRGCNIE